MFSLLVNLQPAEHLLFGFQKCGFQLLGFQAPQAQMCLQNFILIGARVWITVSPPQTNPNLQV